MFNEKIEYSFLDRFQIITAFKFLEKEQLMQHIIYDSQASIFYIDLHNASFSYPTRIPADIIVDFSLNFLKSLDFKDYIDFMLDEYIPIYEDVSALLNTKYKNHAIFAELYEGLLPNFEKIIIELFDNKQRLKEMRNKDILTPIAKFLLSEETISEKYNNDLKPYNALFDFLDSEGIVLPPEASEVIQEFLKKSDEHTFKQVLKNCFIEKNNNNQVVLTIEKKDMLVELLERYKASSSLSEYQKKFFTIQNGGKRIIDKNFNEYMPYIFSPKFETFDKKDNDSITIFGDIEENILIAPLTKTSSMLSIEYFNLKLVENKIRNQVIREGRVSRELFNELTDINRLPKVYLSKENIFKNIFNLQEIIEISGNNNFREQMCQAQALIAFYIELQQNKPAQDLKEFNAYLIGLNKDKMHSKRIKPKELLLDMNSKLFQKYYPLFNSLSNVEWNALIEQFLKFLKLPQNRTIPTINIYPVLFEKFKGSRNDRK